MTENWLNWVLFRLAPICRHLVFFSACYTVDLDKRVTLLAAAHPSDCHTRIFDSAYSVLAALTHRSKRWLVNICMRPIVFQLLYISKVFLCGTDNLVDNYNYTCHYHYSRYKIKIHHNWKLYFKPLIITTESSVSTEFLKINK